VTRALLTGNGAAAWGARLADVDYVPAFPITPQTEIIETLERWIEEGVLSARLVTLESEHSMITAAGAAAATGVRTFTATSSQGLLYGMEMIFTVAGWRTPFVMANVSRAIAAPISLESDHTDVLSTRDSGFLQIHCATCQEVLDSVLLAYRLAEHPRVRVRRFLPEFDAAGIRFRASEPISQAVAVLGGGPYSYFRYEMHRAAEAALPAWDELATDFEAEFGRRPAAVETHRVEDAEIVFFMIGASATKAIAAVDRLREAGWRVGLVRPRLVRPWPEAELRRVLGSARGVAVIDQDLSMGKGGVLHMELASSLYGQPEAPVLVSFVGGLGGRNIPSVEFFEMAAVTREAAEKRCAPAPRLLYTEKELREVRKLQGIALAERGETAPEGAEREEP
jgi:pyruvate ferredoxin oxidoreductase alpha subunit